MHLREMTMADYDEVIDRRHIYHTNDRGAGFWNAIGWYRRDDLRVMSRDIELNRAK